jgi:hypothetical protein
MGFSSAPASQAVLFQDQHDCSFPPLNRECAYKRYACPTTSLVLKSDQRTPERDFQIPRGRVENIQHRPSGLKVNLITLGQLIAVRDVRDSQVHIVLGPRIGSRT